MLQQRVKPTPEFREGRKQRAVSPPRSTASETRIHSKTLLNWAGESRAALPQPFADATLPLMKLTAVFEPAPEGGYTCFVEEVPAAISQGQTLEEAKANLLDALRLVIECQRELAEKNLSPRAVRQPLQFVEA